LRCGGSNAISNAVGYAQHRSRSHDAVIRVYGDAGNVIETLEQAGAAAIAFPYLDFPRLLASFQADVVLTKTNWIVLP
jgi:hypothetical protein